MAPTGAASTGSAGGGGLEGRVVGHAATATAELVGADAGTGGCASLCLWPSRLIVRRPWSVCIGALILFVGLASVSIVIVVSDGWDLDTGTDAFEVRGDAVSSAIYAREFAWDSAQAIRDDAFAEGGSDGSVPVHDAARRAQEMRAAAGAAHERERDHSLLHLPGLYVPGGRRHTVGGRRSLQADASADVSWQWRDVTLAYALDTSNGAENDDTLFTWPRLEAMLDLEAFALAYPGMALFCQPLAPAGTLGGIDAETSSDSGSGDDSGEGTPCAGSIRSILQLVYPQYPSRDGAAGQSLSSLLDAIAAASDDQGGALAGVGDDTKLAWSFDRWFSRCNQTVSAMRSLFALYGVEDELVTFGNTFYADLEAHPATARLKELGVAFAWRDRNQFDTQTDSILADDAGLALGVIVCVFLLTWVHTRSFWVMAATALELALSFPLAYLVYRGVLGVVWMGTLNFLSLFLVVGIGADDSFVVTDAWRQSAVVLPRDDLERRMHWTLSKSARTMAVTSVTSAAAFFANMISTIAPMRLFGLLTGTMVLADFLMTVILVPTTLVLATKTCRGRSVCNVMCDRKRVRSGREAGSGYVDASSKGELIGAHGIVEMTAVHAGEAAGTESSDAVASEPGGTGARGAAAMASSAKADAVVDAVAETDDTGGAAAAADVSMTTATTGSGDWRIVERFFLNSYGPFFERYADKIVMAFALFVAVALVYSFDVQPMRENPQLLPDWHNQRFASVLHEHVFPDTASPVRVTLVYGVEPVDNGVTLEPEGVGTVVWDAEFDPSPPAAQLHLAAVCDEVLAHRPLVRAMAGPCWAHMFRDFALAREDEFGGFPVPQAQFAEALEAFLLTSDGRSVTDENALIVSPDASLPLAAGETRTVHSVMVNVMSTMDWDFDVESRRVQYNLWQSFVADLNAQAVGPGARGVAHAFQTSWIWAEMTTIETLQSVGNVAIQLSLALVFVVLLLSTMNAIVALYATMSLGCIVVTVQALMTWAGMTLGVLEAICLSILVGLGADYIGHCANAYVETPREFTREQRTKAALAHIGISVVASALTTASSGIFLLFTVITFFTLFGLFVITTIVLSVTYALGLFSALCCMFGPEGDTGDVASIGRSIGQCIGWTHVAELPPRDGIGGRGVRVRDGFDDDAASTDGNKGAAAAAAAGSGGDGGDSEQGDSSSSGKGHADRRAAKEYDAWRRRLRCALVACGVVAIGAVIEIGRSRSGHRTDGRSLAADGGVGGGFGERLVVASDGTMATTMSVDLAGGASTSYRCRGFSFPREGTRWVTQFDVIDEIPQVHHMLLFGATTAPSSCPYACDEDMPNTNSLLYAWAVGSSTFHMPPGVGVPVGGTSLATAAVLQIHYAHPDSADHTDPGSGLRLHTTDVAPENEAGTLGLGFHPEDSRVAVPPGVAAFNLTATCAPRLSVPVRVFASMLHAHTLGVAVFAWLERDGETVASLGSEPHYDFNLQRLVKLEPEGGGSDDGNVGVEVLPGDSVSITCVYDSRGRDTTTYGGYATEDEMCMAFLFAYPLHALADPWCFD